MSNFYISDIHGGHSNIIRLCNRPFKNVEEMNETYIRNHNAKVTNTDDVYFVGDIFFGKDVDGAIDFVKKLNGRKHLCIGNHDRKLMQNPEFRKLFIETKDEINVNDNGTKIVLHHCPLAEWEGYFRDTLHFYGHIHNNTDNLAYKLMKQVPNAYNLSCEILGYTPRTLKEVIELNQKFQKEH